MLNGTARVEAFSDGVFAIAITLLILDLKVPSGIQGHLGSALTRQWPSYAAFLISFWCGPPPGETTLARYREIAGAGFNAVLPPCGGPITPELNRRILELCAQTGLKAVVSDPRLEPGEPEPGSSELGAALDGVVADYAKSPALLGYFLQDEPSAGQFSRLAALERGLRERDSKRLAYVNLFPSYASAAQLGLPSYSSQPPSPMQSTGP